VGVVQPRDGVAHLGVDPERTDLDRRDVDDPGAEVGQVAVELLRLVARPGDEHSTAVEGPAGEAVEPAAAVDTRSGDEDHLPVQLATFAGGKLVEGDDQLALAGSAGVEDHRHVRVR
jgi:hypothetical protein